MVHTHFQSTSFFVSGSVCKISHTRCRLYQSEKQVSDPHVSWTVPLPRFGSQSLILHLTSSPTSRPLPPTLAGFPCSGADHVNQKNRYSRGTHAGQASQQNRQRLTQAEVPCWIRNHTCSQNHRQAAQQWTSSTHWVHPGLTYFLTITCHPPSKSGRNPLLHQRSR